MSDDRRRRKDDRSRRHREKTYHGEGSINRDAAIANVRRQEGYVYDEEDTSRSRADPSNPRNANSVSALTSDLGRLSVGSAESTDVQSDHYTTASQYDSVSSYPSGYVAQASYDTTYQTTAAGSYPTTSIPNTYQTSYPYAGTSEDPAVYSTPPATYPDPQAVAASSAYSNYPTPQQWTSPSTLYTENSYLTSSNPAAAQHTQSQGSVREGYSSGERYRESYSDQGNTPYYSTPPQYGNYSPSRREPPAAASPFTYPTTSYEQPGSANMQYPSTEQYYSQDHRQPQISTGYTPQRPALSEPVPGPLLQCGCLGCDRDKLKLPSSEDGTDSQKKGSSSSKKGVSSRAGHSSSRGAESSRSNVPSVSKSASFEITPMVLLCTLTINTCFTLER